MPWPRPTLSELGTRVEGDITSRLTGNAPLMRKAVLKILGKALTALSHILHGFLAYLAENVLADKAEGAWLDRICRARGLTPLVIAATPATGSLTLTGTNGTIVTVGVVFVADTGLEYETTEEVTISGGTATVDVECRTAGLDGNLPAGAVLAIAVPIGGLNESAVTAAAFTTGADQESTEARRERLLALLQEPPAGGSETDYIRWARSVAGVRNAWAFRNYYGGGTVAVAISATGDNIVPTGGLVSDVQAFLEREDIRPITSSPTVVPIEAAVVDIDLSITPYNAVIAEKIQANLAAMFEAEAKPAGQLYLAALQKEITRAGVRDYAINTLEVNGGSVPLTNYPFPAFKYMVLGDVTVDELT